MCGSDRWPMVRIRSCTSEHVVACSTVAARRCASWRQHACASRPRSTTPSRPLAACKAQQPVCDSSVWYQLYLSPWLVAICLCGPANTLSTMNDSSLPTYSDVQAHYRARAELKQSFATLKNDQQDIQELFKTVAAELEATPEIGDKHVLSREWDALRQVRAPLSSVTVKTFDV